MEPIIFLPVLVGFFVVLFSVPVWMRKADQIGLIWEDMHKKGRPKNVKGSGGVAVFLGFILGTLVYIAIITFYFKSTDYLIKILSLICAVLIVGFVGFMDDLLGWKKGGLSRRSRLVLLLFASIPLIVINAGESKMMGIDFGLFYPLILIPIGIVGTTATFNFLAGYNGLETSQGILILSALSLVTWLTGTSWLSVICLIMVACLFAFYIFNKCPAKVFPGDTLTYPLGAMIAIVAILGNIEKIAIFFFIPYIIEVGLKSRGRLKKESFSKLNEDGSLDVPYTKFYGLEHIAVFVLKKIKKDGKAREKEVVYLINLFQIIIILLGFLIFMGRYI